MKLDTEPFSIGMVEIEHKKILVCTDQAEMTTFLPLVMKDLKRACVVLSKGCEVVRPGYWRLTSAAAKVMDRGENLGNPSRVNWVSKTEQHYLSQVSQDNNTDQQADRVSWVSQNSSMNRWADRVSRVNCVSRAGNMEQKIGGSSQVANTGSLVTENSANLESRVTQNLANTESRVT
jgi:hypothetical protein